MAFSKLISKTILASSSNYSKGRSGKKVCKITPHHMAGNLSIETCGSLFKNAGRGASANYGIGSDGRIAGYVDEANRSWCSSSAANDNQAVTVEISNDGGAPNWHVSDKAIEAFIKLSVDVAKRYGIKSFKYDGTSNGTITRHNMFAATACPGPYLTSKLPSITAEINKRLSADTPQTPVQPTTDTYTIKKGDTFWGLEEKWNLKHGTLQSLNPTLKATDLKIGQVIKIKGASTPAPTSFAYGDKVVVSGVGTSNSSGGGAKTMTYNSTKARVMGGKLNGRYPLNCNNNMNGITGWFKAENIRRV